VRTTAPIPVLGAAFALLVLACGSAGVPAEEAERVRRGRDVYSFEGCTSCHGRERQGTRSAPALAALRRHWSAAELTRYLRHPGAYPRDRRLQRLAERFPAEMAGLPAAEAERLRDLVAYLLSP
jgi:cytochrome c553